MGSEFAGDDDTERFEGVVGDAVFDLDPDEYAALKKRDAELDRLIEATKHLPPVSRNAHIAAWRKLRACTGDDDGFIAPDEEAPVYTAVQMTQGGYLVAKKGRAKRRREGLRRNRKFKSSQSRKKLQAAQK